MSALDEHIRRVRVILIPSDFTWLDPMTLLVHQGAMLLRPEGDRGRVIGFTTLCTDVLKRKWWSMPKSDDLIVLCFGCLGATEQ